MQHSRLYIELMWSWIQGIHKDICKNANVHHLDVRIADHENKAEELL